MNKDVSFTGFGSRYVPQRAWLAAARCAPGPDGQRFLAAVRAETGAPTIHVVTNWLKAARGVAK